MLILHQHTPIEGAAGTALTSAAEILRRDMNAVLTDGESGGRILLLPDASLEDENFRITVEEAGITIRHGDDLGGVFGLLYISEHFLGIHPMFYWNDQPLPRMKGAEIPCGVYDAPVYAVRHRGWFINDEVLLDPWKTTEAEHREVWRMVFETVLRCGGNMVIPGTDRAEDGLEMLASDMGLILTHHHAELLGARMFGRVWPELKGSYRLYPEKFEQLWREAAEKYHGRKVIYAIGFRGQFDGPFWLEDPSFATEEARGREISRIMRRQMDIVREVEPGAVFCTNLYGEMMELYRKGFLEIPDGVTKIWADNGFGRMISRRQGSVNPRVPAMPQHESGKNGIYYHASFYDLQAANHISQLQVPPAMVAEELNQVVANGAADYWIINSGSVKSHIYMLDLIREAWTAGHVDAEAHARAYARMYYGDERVARLLLGYSENAVPYGPHPDDLAGDQYFHHVPRILATHLMRGETGQAAELCWAETGTLFEQAAKVGQRCRRGSAGWRAFTEACEAMAVSLSAEAGQLLRDTVGLSGQIHLHGCEGVAALAEGMAHYEKEEYDLAFLAFGDAWTAAKAGYAALMAAEHDNWINYYHNDCFVNLKLTVEVMRALMAWVRVTHDGPNFWLWERKYLMTPEDVRIRLQTHRHCQYTDEELYALLKQRS